MERKSYAAAQQAGRDGVRTALLDTASRLLSAEGVGALTMRRIATEVGCSTTVLYTMFGSKDGIADALCREGFDRFRLRLAELPPEVPGGSGDPVARVRALAAAYRGFAVEEPHYYRVMFLQAVPGYTPTGATLAAGDAAFEVLVEAARAGVEAGVFDGDPHAIAEVWLAAAHGAVSLELTGHLRPEVAAARHAAVVDAAITYFLR